MSTVSRGKLHKLLSEALIVVMIFACLAWADIAGSPYASALSKVCKTTASSLIIRSGAGTSYKKIGSLPRGTYKEIRSSKKAKDGTTWYKVTDDGKSGYISGKYVDVINLSVTKVSGLDGRVDTSGSKVTLRKGPGSVYGKAGTIGDGKKFTVTGKGKDVYGKLWYRFKKDGDEVFIHSKYVKTVKAASSTTTKSTTKSTTTKATTKSTTTKATTKSTTTKSTTTKATTKATSSSGTTTTKTTLIGTVNTSSGNLNVRSGAGTSYEVIGSLKKGATFTITGQKKVSGTTWYKLTLKGKTGYVSSQYVKTKTVTQTTQATTKSSTTTKSTTKAPSAVTFTIGIVESGTTLNVRTGAGTSFSKLGTLAGGTAVEIKGSAKAANGVTWYKYAFSPGKTGYICASYVTKKKVKSDAAFEAAMTEQGFPDSYKPGLRLLHVTHPKWQFKSYRTGIKWSTALNAETKSVGLNLVSPSLPKSYRSKASGAYNSKSGTWTRFDGRWYAASKTVVAHYMDPRNFLDEGGIYQFMIHKYDAGSQSVKTVRAVVKGSFMETRKTGNATYPTYAELINAAGKSAGVNPNVLAAMILQEQGYKGTSGIISGKYSGYKGYYNFLNVGAYTTSGMSAVQRGLWYAKQSGSYGRPWNSVYKSVKGGALFYATNYVKAKQDNYYFKKFNMKNGVSRIGVHQYMTNVTAAADEGSLLRKAFSGNDSYAAVIEIPVYNSMPANPAQLP